MRRLLTLSFLLLSFANLRVSAQQSLSDEEKKRLFLKAREEMTTIPYVPPAPAATPKPRPHPAATPEPIKPVSRPPAPTPEPEPRPTPRPAPPKSTPPPAITRPEETPTPPRANIIVREAGVAKADDDDEPPPVKESIWSRIFGTGGNYKYLTPSVRRAIDSAPVTKGRWRYIVVHNSGTRQGSAKAFEHYHRFVRGMPNGMAYQFVIGNGTSTGNGSIEIGNRWHRQIQGGHVHSDYLNNIALGICLVGDFNNDKPTNAQLEALEELIKYLRRRVGRIQGQEAVVRAHREINPPRWPTDCPGGDFPYAWLHRKF